MRHINNCQKNKKEKSKRGFGLFGLDKVRAVDIFLGLYDMFAVTVAYFLALWIRFDGRFSEIPGEYLYTWLKFVPIYLAACLVVFNIFHLYRSIWKFASFVELKRVAYSSLILGIFHTVAITLIFRRMPISYYVMGIAIQFAMVLFIRFGYRFISLERSKNAKVSKNSPKNKVMLIGAGVAGQMILRDIRNSEDMDEEVLCIIDDDKSKWGRDIDGVKIVGGREDILLSVEKYGIEKIYLTMPSASAEERRDILDICKETKCVLKSLPGIKDMVSDAISTKSMKDVDVVDLLGREPVQVDMNDIYDFITGKTIIVTGGGGSIGSELCRQIASHNPKKLIVFDIYENNAHEIGLELRDKYPSLDLEVLIGSVRDSRRLNQVFSKFKPDVVYHAAAHKHVPLMEYSPCESIKNNAVGTYKTAYAAMMNGCKRFVLISTDKAVNPTNIMGASKRICEMIIQSFDKKIRDGKAKDLVPINLHAEPTVESNTERESFSPKTEFVAVRFGNVLGSNGSVIPRFKEQIAKGGPVTVTHPDIIRYFMTIPEATSLVLQAGTYARGGEIFVLDMGAPVKIDTLARNLIRLSGLTPDVDIMVSYTGLRPGEKLYEEKLMSEEGLKTTKNKLIHIGAPVEFDTDAFLEQLSILMNAAYDGDEEQIRDLVKQTVTTYYPAGEHGSEYKGKAYQKQMAEVAEKELEEAAAV